MPAKTNLTSEQLYITLEVFCRDYVAPDGRRVGLHQRGSDLLLLIPNAVATQNEQGQTHFITGSSSEPGLEPTGEATTAATPDK